MKKPVDSFDPQAIRAQFPLLASHFHGKPLIYLDNAATTQKPASVIETEKNYYEAINANIHRGVYALSQLATEAYEQSRERVAKFINAAEDREVIFTRGTTDSINLVAAAWGRQNLTIGDEILITAMEHHSNIVPWQLIAGQTGAVLRVVPMNDRGELRMDEFDRLLSPRTKIVAVVHVSNSLGTINPVGEIIAKAHQRGAVVLIDGAQWVAHGPTDVRSLDADFYAFSGHKLYGPTGIGVLYGKAKLLEAMPPYQGGGDMISSVTFEKTTYNVLPYKFEAGTPNIAGGVTLGAAIDFVSSIGFEAIGAHEQALLERGTKALSAIPGVRIVGTAEKKGAVISFVVEKPLIAPLDVGARLDLAGIAIRTGHHCCQPVMDRLHISATARASFALYNTIEEVDAFSAALRRIIAEESARSHGTAAPNQSQIRFPQASAVSPQAAAEELAESFDLLGEWDQRHEYLVELGDKLLPLPAEFATESNRVRGCQSTVHLITRPKPDDKDRLEILATSDAAIVRGLIALLQRVYSGQRADDILAFDIERMLHRLGLDQHLSMGRRNGLGGMIQRIRAAALTIAGKPAPARSAL